MPPAMPASICPVPIDRARVEMAVREDAQARLTVEKGVLGGIPAARAAERPALEPPSSARTVPMWMSCRMEGSRSGWALSVARRT